jgi:integrase
MRRGRRLWKRGDIWWGTHYPQGPGGPRERRSTGCADERAAALVLDGWERESAVARLDPHHAKRQAATLSQALDLLVEHRAELARANKKSPATAAFYEQKAKNWTAFLGNDFPLHRLDSTHVERFISSRRAVDPETKAPFASESTIHKELVTLRAALKRAKILKLWRGDVGEIIEPGFASDYQARTAHVPDLASAWRLIHEVEHESGAGRAAIVAFSIATGAERSAIFRARREDVTKTSVLVPLHGTKRKTRERQVPIVLPWQKALLSFASKNADGTEGSLFRPWVNARRGILGAARRARLPPLTYNDLRRTYGMWMRGEGIAPALIAPTMGHASGDMVERVYGRLTGADVAKQIGEVISIRDADRRRAKRAS